MEQQIITDNTPVKKIASKVIALDEPNSLRDRLGCTEWASTESITVMSAIGVKDIALLRGLAHYSLKSIDLQDATIATLPANAFDGCEALEAIKLPACNNIPQNTCSNCPSLKLIEINKQTTNIEDNAFYNCQVLESIELPANLSVIGKLAFANCANLRAVVIKAQYPPICNEDTFNGIASDCCFTVPQGHLNDYQTDGYWKKFKLVESET